MTDKTKTSPPQKKSPRLSNSKPHDSSSKLIFGNAELCSQFLRNYMDIPILKNVRAEDIEDVTERYIPMFTEERNSDTVKRIKLAENNTLFFVSLIEHKTKVDYNVSMQLLRYMVYIWEDYEKEMARLVELNSYSIGQLVEKNDELSLVMLINRLQSSTEFQKINLPEDYIKNLSEHSTDELLDIIAKVTATMLRHLNLPEDEVAEFTGQVKERKMAELFENFKDVDIPAIRKKAQARGWAKGHTEGLAEGLAEGEARFAKLTKLLLQTNHMDDLTKALGDLTYRDKLYKQYNI